MGSVKFVRWLIYEGGIMGDRNATAGPIRLRSGQAFDSPPLRFGSLRMTIFKLVATPTMEQPLFCGRNTDGGCTEVRPP
jgi:hypothetical protein